MDKRYQVFVSSTFSDLQDERQEVMQALLELDCIPSGMELFPAANEDQWTLIKKVISDCDYYMVIVGGRYGSIGPAGFSYTEMEYRFAVELGKPILGFLHKDPSQIVAHKTESSTEGKAKLEQFRELVKTRMCRFWDSPSELGSQVSRSLVKLIKSNPAIGWVRGDLVPSEGANAEILRLRRLVEELEKKLSSSAYEAPEGTEKLAQGDDVFSVNYSFVASPTRFAHRGEGYTDTVELTWDEVFSAVAPLMIDEANEDQLIEAVNALVGAKASPALKRRRDFASLYLLNFEVFKDDFQTMKVQLRALGLIAKSDKNRSIKDTATYWALTPYGDTQLIRLRAIHKHDA